MLLLTCHLICKYIKWLCHLFVISRETGSVLRRTVLWDCFGDAIISRSFIGYFEVAQETGAEFVNLQFDTTLIQFLDLIRF